MVFNLQDLIFQLEKLLEEVPTREYEDRESRYYKRINPIKIQDWNAQITTILIKIDNNLQTKFNNAFKSFQSKVSECYPIAYTPHVEKALNDSKNCLTEIIENLKKNYTNL